MLLCNIEGINFAKVIVGPVETIEYLQFWPESYATWTVSGFSPGDHIVVDTR